jgi:hypothetical protein
MRGKRDVPEMSNADLKRLLDQAMTRFENWRVDVERKPNPMMIHSLKNIMSIIETITSMSDRRVEYSYKALVSRMAELMNETAALNMAIVTSLKDDSIDKKEMAIISKRLFSLVNAAAELARLVQDNFGAPELGTGTGEGLIPTGRRVEGEP